MFFQMTLFFCFSTVLFGRQSQPTNCIVSNNNTGGLLCQEEPSGSKRKISCSFPENTNISINNCSKRITEINIKFASNIVFEQMMKRSRNIFRFPLNKSQKTLLNITIQRFNRIIIDTNYLQSILGNDTNTFYTVLNISILELETNQTIPIVNNTLVDMNMKQFYVYIKHPSNTTMLFYNRTRKKTVSIQTSTEGSSTTMQTVTSTKSNTMNTTNEFGSSQSISTESSTGTNITTAEENTTMFLVDMSQSNEDSTMEISTLSIYSTSSIVPIRNVSRKISLLSSMMTTSNSNERISSQSSTSTRSSKQSNNYLLLLIPILLLLTIILSTVMIFVYVYHRRRKSSEENLSTMSTLNNTEYSTTDDSSAINSQSDISSMKRSAIYLSPGPTPR